MDWDKLKVFHAAAEAGSFTHAGEQLGLSQSAVSRQVSALEQELAVALFHRHARGLILTEQGELLYRTAHEVFMKLEAARTKLTDSREKPHGELKVQTTVGLGVHWLTPRLGEFLELYPDIRITLMTTEQELDLAMREADVAIRLRLPTQPDLIQRKLFSVRFHAYASPEYLKRFNTPRSIEDLDVHRVLLLGGTIPTYLQPTRWLVEVGRDSKGSRRAAASHYQQRASASCAPASARPRHRDAAGLSGRGERRIWCSCSPKPIRSRSTPTSSIRKSLKTVARVQAFRDFLVSKAQRWSWLRRCTRGLHPRAIAPITTAHTGFYWAAYPCRRTGVLFARRYALTLRHCVTKDLSPSHG